MAFWCRKCVVVVLPLVLVVSGCAIAKKENRRLLNALDSVVQIESTPARIAAAPVCVPVAVAAGVADAVVVHPAVSIRYAASDTYELLWVSQGRSPFEKAVLFIPVVVLTPVVFTTDWLVRSLFPI